MIVFARRLRLLKNVGVGLVVLGCMLIPSRAQGPDQQLPLVTAGALPLYQMMARAARIEGTVKIRVITDGKKVSSMDEETGPAMLVKAAKENIRTWEFLEHPPTSFVTTFLYRIEEPAQCFYSNGATTLNIPLEVRVTVKGFMTCDPAATITSVVAPKKKR